MASGEWGAVPESLYFGFRGRGDLRLVNGEWGVRLLLNCSPFATRHSPFLVYFCFRWRLRSKVSNCLPSISVS